jgi:hypothetical protein
MSYISLLAVSAVNSADGILLFSQNKLHSPGPFFPKLFTYWVEEVPYTLDPGFGWLCNKEFSFSIIYVTLYGVNKEDHEDYDGKQLTTRSKVLL